MDSRRYSKQKRYQASLHAQDSAPARKWNQGEIQPGSRRAAWRGMKRLRLVPREKDPDPYSGQDVRRSEH